MTSVLLFKLITSIQHQILLEYNHLRNEFQKAVPKMNPTFMFLYLTDQVNNNQHHQHHQQDQPHHHSYLTLHQISSTSWAEVNVLICMTRDWWLIVQPRSCIMNTWWQWMSGHLRPYDIVSRWTTGVWIYRVTHQRPIHRCTELLHIVLTIMCRCVWNEIFYYCLLVI